jgi:hypothetical protein
MYCRHQEVIYFNFTDYMLHFLTGSAFSGGKQVPLGGGMMPGGDGKKVDISASASAKIDFSLPSWRPRRCFGLRGARSTVHPTFSLGLSREKGSVPTRYNFRRH